MAAPGEYLVWEDMDGDGRTDLFWPGQTGPNGEQWTPVIFVAKKPLLLLLKLIFGKRGIPFEAVKVFKNYSGKAGLIPCFYFPEF